MVKISMNNEKQLEILRKQIAKRENRHKLLAIKLFSSGTLLIAILIIIYSIATTGGVTNV